MSVLVHAVDRPGVPPFRMPDRFRVEVVHFATPAGEGDAPARLGEHEFWIRREDALQAQDDGVLRVVSILDSSHRTELELTEEQEAWLDWLLANDVRHIRLESAH